MLIDIRCPGCDESFPVTESAVELQVDCPTCGHRFAVPPTQSAAPPAAAPPQVKSKPRPASSARKRPGRRDDDEDDEDRSAAPASPVAVIAVLAAALLFVIGGLALTAYLILSPSKPEVADENTPAGGPPAGVVNPPVGAGPPGEPPPIRPGPPGGPPRPTVPLPPAVKLPEPAGEICAGGGGKYLFIHLKRARQVAVFDTAAGKITKYIPVADDDVLIAAGLNHLVVGFPVQKLISRYSLATFEKDTTVQVPSKWPLLAIGMGAGSNGPLLTGCADYPWGGEWFLIDVLNMQRAPNSDLKDGCVHASPGVRIRTSHEGRVFTAEGGGLGARAGAFVIRPTGWGNQPSPCVPPLINPDGDTIYGNGVMATPDGKTVGEQRDKTGAVWYVPAVYGPFVLAVTEMKEGQWPNEQKYLAGQLHIGRDVRPLVSLGELPELEGLADGFASGTKPVDQHVIYAPHARKLILLPTNRDRLYVRAIDPRAELAKTPKDYLVVVSRPPAAAKGQGFKYVPEVWSKKGGVKLRLDAGPPGMAVQGGAVTWDVPASYAGTSADVILSVTDASGQETFHTFEVAVYPAK